jgi:hypothetical protein
MLQVLRRVKFGKRGWPLVAVVVAVVLAVAGLAGVTVLAGGGGPRTHFFEVTFEVGSNESDLGTGMLAYDDQTYFEVNLTDERIVAVEVRLEWSDQGNTPLADPFVDLAIFNETRDIVSIAEIHAPGGTLHVDVANPIPPNGTVSANDSGEAVAAASAGVNNTTAGQGTWGFFLSAQAPTRVRPYVGASIHYQLWITVFTYEGTAIVVAGK